MWLSLFLGLSWIDRLVLLLTLIVAILAWPERFVWGHSSAAESHAVVTLRMLKTDLENTRNKQPRDGYPRAMPTTNLCVILHPAYRFEYVPSSSPDGKIFDYLIHAIPARPDCGCCLRSITILDDGRIYYTLDTRPATMLDQLLESSVRDPR